METFAQNSLKPSGRSGLHNTVMLGSGDGPKLYRVCKKRKEVLVTLVRPSLKRPPIDSVTHVGSPAKISL